MLRNRLIQLCIAAATSAVMVHSAVAADVTNLVSLTNFEYPVDPQEPVGTMEYSYPYKYDWGGTAPFDYSHTFNAAYYDINDWEYTNAMGQFTFNNTGYGEFMTNNAGAGYGFGFGGGLRYEFSDGTPLISTNRFDYILSFDVRVEGLKPERTTVTGEAQIRFEAPDDTIQPPDANTETDKLMQVNKNVSFGSNWTHVAFTLDTGGIADNKDETDFILYKAFVNNLNFGFNFHQPEGAFDYDWDNAVYIDNIRFEVVQREPLPPPPPTVAFMICEYNWDDKPVWYSWGDGGTGWSANTNKATYYVTNNAAEVGVGGSNGFVFRMDNYVMTNGAPAWAGGNCGFGGPGDYSQITTPDLSRYNLLIDARVLGLNPGSYKANATVQLAFLAPDDTLQPSDTNTNRDQLIRLDFNVPNIATNWQTFRLPLDKAAVGSGSKANISNYFAVIVESNFQVQFQNAHSTNNWGYDDDNMFIMDNVGIERLDVGCPPLNIANGTVSWAPPSSGTVKLEQASDVNGTWTEVVGATSPYTIPPGDTQKFFRTLWVPPPQ